MAKGKQEADAKIVSFNMRIPQELYYRVIKSANKNGRSYNLEMVRAVESYLDGHADLNLMVEGLREMARKQEGAVKDGGVVVSISKKSAEGRR